MPERIPLYHVQATPNADNTVMVEPSGVEPLTS